MQVNLWDPLTFALMILGFIIFFYAIMYFKGLFWFQQTQEDSGDNWFARIEQKEAASGGWIRRYGRPAIVLDMLIIFTYPIITYLDVLSPFQFFIYIFAFFIPAQLILVILVSVMYIRVGRHRT